MLSDAQLIRYFTCGEDEVRAWTIRKGTKAPQAAGVIQYVLVLPVNMLTYTLTTSNSSDFEAKFVCGEIMSLADLQEYGSESAVKAAGKLRQQGKPYESMFLYPRSYCSADDVLVVDGDIAYWKSGA